MHEIGNFATESGDLADEARADIRRVERGHHEHRLQTRRQMPIHQRHLVLVFEIAHGAQAANEKLRLGRAREVDEKAAELFHLDARFVIERGTNQLHTLADGEQRLL